MMSHVSFPLETQTRSTRIPRASRLSQQEPPAFCLQLTRRRTCQSKDIGATTLYCIFEYISFVSGYPGRSYPRVYTTSPLKFMAPLHCAVIRNKESRRSKGCTLHNHVETSLRVTSERQDGEQRENRVVQRGNGGGGG